MKQLISIGLFFFIWGVIFCPTAQAKNMYVNDVIKITLRRGPGISHKVIGMLQSGQMVNALDTQGDWTYVRIPDGKTGWALTRFLTSKKPNEVQLDILQKKYDSLSEQSKKLENENKTLKKENRTLQNQSNTFKKSYEDVTQSYESLKNDSKDYLALKEKYETAASDLSEHKEKTGSLEKRLSKLEFKQNLIMFLGGAGTFFFGLFIGKVSQKGRGRF